MTPLPLGATPRRRRPAPAPPVRPTPAPPASTTCSVSSGPPPAPDRFYDDQVRDHLNPQMRDFVRRQEMFFLATSDAAGACDSTLRAGPPGSCSRCSTARPSPGRSSGATG